MAFPTLTANSGNQADLVSSNVTISFPSGIQSGDLVLIFLSSDKAPTTTYPTGWTKHFEMDMSANGGTGLTSMATFVANATHPGSTEVVQRTGDDEVAWFAFRVTGTTGTISFANAQGSSTTTAPPSVTASWGTDDNLWIALSGADNDSHTSGPTGYSNFTATGNLDAQVGYATLEKATNTETPNTFTLSGTNEWVTATVVVQPSVSGGPQATEITSNSEVDTPTITEVGFPRDIPGAIWPTVGSGAVGPFLNGANVYVVGYDGTDIAVYKSATPKTSGTWSAQDATNQPNFAPAYIDSYQDGTDLHIMIVTTTTFDTHYMQFDLATDTWVEANNYGGTGGTYSESIYSPTDDPTTAWGGVTVRSDGDIIIVHPGENPVEMGGNYQIVSYSRYESGTGWTKATTVASTVAKDDSYWYAYPVMGSSDQVHFGYVRNTDSDFYLRSANGTNGLQTQRTHVGTFAGVTGGTNFTRSSTEQIAFQVRNAGTFDRIYFDHFTDDTSPTFTEETITSSGSSADDPFTSTIIDDSANTSTQPNYAAYIDSTSQDIFLMGDGGGTTWSDQNSSTAIRTGTVDGISATIYSRDNNRVYAFIYDDNGTTKYDEFILYAEGTSLTASEISSNSEVDSTTLTQSHVLTATEITSNSEVDTPTGGYVFTATEITSNSEVDSATGGYVFAATEITSNSEVDSSTLTQTHVLAATEINSLSEVDQTNITQEHALTVTEITSNSEVDTPTLTQEHALTATEITSNSEVDTPTLTQNHQLTVTEITSNSEVDTPTLTQSHTLTATEITSNSEVDTPTLTVVFQFAVTEITSNSEVDTSTLTQEHALTVTEITSNSEVDTSTLTQNHQLTVTEITSNSEVDTPTLTQNHQLTVTEITSNSEVDTPTLTQSHTLTATEIESASEVDTTNITQNHQLTVTEITSNSEVDTSTLTQNHQLTVTEINSTSEVDTTNITQNHQLAVTEITSNSEVDTPTLTQNHQLTVTEITSNSEVDSATLTQNHQLTVTEITSNSEVDSAQGGYVFTATEITSNSEVDNPTLTENATNLTATEITSNSEVDTPTLTQSHTLTVTEINSTSEVDTTNITQNHQLAVTEITANSEVDTPTLTQSHTLTVTEITSNSEVDTPTLTQNHQLAVTEITSNSEVDSAQGGYILTVTEITSNSEVDNTTLTQNHSLTVTEINSTSEVDTTNITQNHQLAVTEITSNSEVDTPTLTQNHQLAVTEITSNSEVDTPTLTQNHSLTATEITANSEVDTPTLSGSIDLGTPTEIESASTYRGPVLVPADGVPGFQSYFANVAYSLTTTSSVNAWHTLHGVDTNCLVVCMTFFSGDVVASPSKTYTLTFGGNPMTAAMSYDPPDNEYVSLIYYLIDPPTANSQLSISTNDEFNSITVSLVELKGINDVSPIGNTQNASAETTAITPESSNAIIVTVRTDKEMGQGGVTPSTDNIELIDTPGGGL
jgi:hypothetical protein